MGSRAEPREDPATDPPEPEARDPSRSDGARTRADDGISDERRRKSDGASDGRLICVADAGTMSSRLDRPRRADSAAARSSSPIESERCDGIESEGRVGSLLADPSDPPWGSASAPESPLSLR
ncbi:hypothetical protein THAOC_24785 [Thalassiosira oceanica]|uniref:Uncharacterized protein n=1 Tax=Thalassiosira oceanica TaxID=159749 RepID=K0S9P4_THAOC|nr:hypothetical protein THAOC_24785 [Thalassiosira oceanica]|eukprot:EJK55482.1 hypothetical protein THAOC_24785 [Thalassiosira oceanica]